jgi:hypothetical protein
MVRNGIAIFFCSLEKTAAARLLETRMDVRRNGLLWNAFGANTSDMHRDDTGPQAPRRIGDLGKP